MCGTVRQDLKNASEDEWDYQLCACAASIGWVLPLGFHE